MIERAFLDFSVAKLRQYVERIQACTDLLTEDAIWARGHAVENSIGNLCLHLRGNVQQWIVAGVGGTEDVRDRASEFAAKGGASRADLMAGLRQTVESACAVITSLNAACLVDEIAIQGYHQTTLEAIYHVVEHFAGHTGQIIFATKALRGEDLGFYRHLSDTSHGKVTP